MLNMPIKENLRMAIYYAPRGRFRLYALASELSQKYLYPTDLLIGIIGAEGSGKSTLIKGLFPGMELTNDDDGINKRTAPIFDFSETDYFSGHTFHIDVRYELAFHQLHEIVEAVRTVLAARRRVIVEHFDLIYRMLGFNAQIIFAIGEEVRVYRPSVFGPSPLKIKKVADDNLKFRLMAHSAEDIVGKILKDDYGIDRENQHSDVRHGFIIGFDEQPAINLAELEAKALDVIHRDIPISPADGDFILMGDQPFHCTGKRIHVKRSSHIENFRLIKDYTFDPVSKKYLLVGIVGAESIEIFDELPPVSEGIRDFDLH
jgi:GTPase SAR1 family protein